jgi:hypothetical protein
MHGAGKNLIMSNGGRHGTGGTYLQGQAIPDDVAPMVPKELLGGVQAPPARPPVPAMTLQLAPPQPVEQVKTQEQAAQTPAQTPAPPPTPPTTTPPAAVVETAATPPTSNTDGIPKNRKDVFLLSKEQTVALASKLGLTFDPNEPAKAIKERIHEHLGL